MTKPVTVMHVKRRRLGLTQAELARIIGVTQPRISAWENRTADIPEKRRDEIADALDADANDLTNDA
jgi:transcriptional regulator with XRE-family HTH domain